MKRLLLTVLVSFILFSAHSQEQFSRVKIFATHEQLRELVSSGVAIDNGIFKAGVYVICELSSSELAVVKNEGIAYEVLIDDVSAYYRQRNEPFLTQLDEMKQMEYSLSRDWPVPAGFELGPVGGFLSIDQCMEHLDSMAAQFPDKVSPRNTLDYQTHNGQELYWVRLSDNPTVDEDEPEVLYTGMHHAREAIGMQAILYYMYYLLENYDTDPDVQYIVDNFELYFVPVMNMDGYAYNIQTDPNGGGMWRKNRRVNGGGSYGVDLNRNYGYMWGYDNEGSSPYPDDETYRGPEAFSEPENQSIKNFCEAHEFKIAINYHSYASLLLYPWGWSDTPCPHDAIFNAHSQILTTENNYEYGAGSTTIYPTNGGSDDWMYGEQSTKDLIYSYTPEVGNSGDGFWPSVSRIIPLCQESMYMNIMAAMLSGPYAKASELSPAIIETTSGQFPFELQQIGLDNSATYTLSVQPLSDAITSISGPQEFTGLEALEIVSGAFDFILKEDIHSGERVDFVFSVNNGLITVNDTISKIFGSPVIIFEDDGSTLEKWTSNQWNITTVQFNSPPTSIADSPFGEYSNYENNVITLASSIDLSEEAYASLNFWARWDLESGYDFVQVLVSANGGLNWVPLDGKYTHPGTSNQAPGEPLYDGTQETWVKEEISLEPFLGSEIKLRFVLESDSYITGDGFYWDDMTITAIDIATGIGNDQSSGPVTRLSVRPNPASETVSFDYSLAEFENGRNELQVSDIKGAKIYSSILHDETGTLKLDVSSWDPGIYFYSVYFDHSIISKGKLIVR